jgi:hypothetical protein
MLAMVEVTAEAVGGTPHRLLLAFPTGLALTLDSEGRLTRHWKRTSIGISARDTGSEGTLKSFDRWTFEQGVSSVAKMSASWDSSKVCEVKEDSQIQDPEGDARKHCREAGSPAGLQIALTERR